MPYKDPVAQKEAQRRWYLRKIGQDPGWIPARRERKNNWAMEQRRKHGPTKRKIARDEMLRRHAEVSGLVAEARKSGCLLCGENATCCLDFHHVDPKTKSFGIARRTLKYNAVKIREELAKCVVLCKNCHCKLHAGFVHLPDAIKPNCAAGPAVKASAESDAGAFTGEVDQ